MGTAQALHKWCSCLPASLRGGTNLISEMHVLDALVVILALGMVCGPGIWNFPASSLSTISTCSSFP